MSNIISYLQIAVSIALIILILLQERSAGLSGLFGGEGGGFYQARRGLERSIFISTIVLSLVFVGLAVYTILR